MCPSNVACVLSRIKVVSLLPNPACPRPQRSSSTMGTHTLELGPQLLQMGPDLNPQSHHAVNQTVPWTLELISFPEHLYSRTHSVTVPHAPLYTRSFIIARVPMSQIWYYEGLQQHRYPYGRKFNQEVPSSLCHRGPHQPLPLLHILSALASENP